MNTLEVLRSLGLSEKESEIYMGLLVLGEGSVLEISKKTGVKRPTCYIALQSLEERGFVSKLMRRNKSVFVPQHPRKLLTEAELRLREIEATIPQFEAALKRSDDRPRVMIFEGKDALDVAYDEVFLTKGEILFMSDVELSYKAYERTLAKFDYYAKFSSDFSTREVLIDSPFSHEYAKRVEGPHRKCRIMPKIFSPFATDIGVYGDYALITSVKKEYFVVKIQSKEIAHAFRAMFEAMWMVSRPPEAATS